MGTAGTYLLQDFRLARAELPQTRCIDVCLLHSQRTLADEPLSLASI
jgi:hypothetical protein